MSDLDPNTSNATMEDWSDFTFDAVWMSIPLWARLFSRTLDFRRLTGAIVTRAEFIQGESIDCPEKFLRVLHRAREALAKRDVDTGWKCLYLFDRYCLDFLEDNQIEARLVSAMEEADEKLQGWRLKAAQRLIGGLFGELLAESQGTEHEFETERSSLPKANLDPKLRAKFLSHLKEAEFHLHCEAENVYHKIGRLSKQTGIVALLLIVVVSCLAVLNFVGAFDVLGLRFSGGVGMAMLIGLLGGVLSVAFTVARSNPRRKIPKIKSDFLATLTRPLIGPAVALPILIVVNSDMFNFPSEASLVLCFLGGFSERWFLGIAQKLEEAAT